MKKNIRMFLAPLLCIALTIAATPASAAGPVQNGTPVFVSYTSGNTHWVDLDAVFFSGDASGSANSTISIDASQKFQEFEGIGFSLEETSISNLWKLSKEVREETLRTVVEDWGVDMFRLVIGCCDCNEKYPFWSLDDTPGNIDDFEMKYFNIDADREQHIIETLKFILSLNPNVKFFASAWSAPAWMKEIRYIDGDNGFVKNADGSYKVMTNSDGTPYRRYVGWVESNTYTLPSGAKNTRLEQMNYLRDDCIDAFAEYYTRYLEAYKAEGIGIYAITVLNEPGADVIYPAMNLTIEQHQLLGRAIKNKFRERGFDTQLWAHDWNVDDWYSQKNDAGQTVNDPSEDNHYKVFLDSAVATGAEMLQTYDGVAFHPYTGGPDRIPAQVKPYVGDMKIHQTESNEFGASTLINWFNYGASSYLAWVPFTDMNGGIHHWTGTKLNDYEPPAAGGWRNRIGTTRHDGSNDYVTFTNNFYAWGQFTRYITSGSGRPGDEGAVRIYSTPGTQSNVSATAFQNPNGEIVLVVANGSGQTRTLKVVMDGKAFITTLNGSSTTTFRWNPGMVIVTDGNGKPFANEGRSGHDAAIDVIVTPVDGASYTWSVNGNDAKAVTAADGWKIPISKPTSDEPSVLTVTATKDGVSETYSHTFAVKHQLRATSSSGKVIAESYNNGASITNGTVILAIYDRNGRLSALESVNVSVLPGGSRKVTFASDAVTYPMDKYIYKVFFWDADYLPLTPAVAI